MPNYYIYLLLFGANYKTIEDHFFQVFEHNFLTSNFIFKLYNFEMTFFPLFLLHLYSQINQPLGKVDVVERSAPWLGDREVRGSNPALGYIFCGKRKIKMQLPLRREPWNEIDRA